MYLASHGNDSDSTNAKARPASRSYGRFLQPDPLGYEDSPNLYAYVLNDPVNLIDPLGLTACQPVNEPGTRITCLSTDSSGGSQPAGSGMGSPFAGLFPGGGVMIGGGRSLFGGSFVCTNCGQPAPGGSGPNDPVIITAPQYEWVPAINFGSDFGFCESSISCAMGANNARYLRGEISAAERRSAEVNAAIGGGVGLAIGLAGVGVAEATSIEGAAAGLRYGSGRLGQIRFFGDRLILRIDINKPITHLNIQGNLFGRAFNFHIPPF